MITITPRFKRCHIIELPMIDPTILQPELLDCRPSPEAVQQKLEDLRSANPELTPCDTVEEGSVVGCSLTGPTPRYQRDDITLSVGRHIFDSQVEDALIGRRAGEIVSIPTAEGIVTAYIRSAHNLELPALDDRLVQRITDSSTETLAHYRLTLIRELTQDALRRSQDTAATLLINHLADHACYRIDEAEWSETVQQELEAEKARIQGSSPSEDWEKTWEMNRPTFEVVIPKRLRRRMVQEKLFELADRGSDIPSYESFLTERAQREGRSPEVLKELYSPAWYEQTQLSRVAQEHVLTNISFQQ